jgi:hypothetical protein
MNVISNILCEIFIVFILLLITGFLIYFLDNLDKNEILENIWIIILMIFCYILLFLYFVYFIVAFKRLINKVYVMDINILCNQTEIYLHEMNSKFVIRNFLHQFFKNKLTINDLIKYKKENLYNFRNPRILANKI